TCTTCRKLVTLLREEGIGFDRIDYYVEPLTRAKLGELVRKMGIEPRALLRPAASGRDPRLSDPATPADVILDAMVQDPDLIQRPIVERGERAVLARPVERVRELL